MSTRKSLPKTALPRIYFIDRQIASGKYPNTSELAREYETSVSSISRDIEFMRDSLGAPIGYDAVARGYYYTEKTYRLPSAFATVEDMLALGMAKTILSLYRETPLYETAKEFLEGISAPLMGDKDPRWYENRIVVPPVASAPVNVDIWNVITAGLQENKIITFEYQGEWDEKYKNRRVRPYQLLFDMGVWYLYGYAEERKAIRIFSLPRMKNPALTKDTFTLPKDFDYCSQADGSNFGIFTGAKKFHFRVAFYDNSVSWVQERKWAADQSIKKTKDGVIITFTSTQYNKVLEWVLSRGCTAQPLEPAELVRDWKRHIRQMQKSNYL
jgi:predicted DNA-binding transcriptional regulator YafY